MEMLKKNTVLTTVFDEYRVLSQINQGGNGTVFLVKNSGGDELAIKVIDRTKTAISKLKRFRNELAFCQNNLHKNIVRVIDHGVLRQDQTDVAFYVMPYFPFTLRTKMNETLSPELKLSVFVQLMKALEFAHNKKVWHRDIKPENILVDENDNVVLADFGIAHFCDELLITAVETKAAERLANFQYSAPEQRIKGNPVDGRADIYSAGLILNELFTGKIVSGTAFTKIADVNEDFGFLDALVDEMIAQTPENRLFPTDKVLFRLEVLDSEHRAQAAFEKLNVDNQNNRADFTSLQPPQAIGADYNNGLLSIKLDQDMPKEWCEVLRGGHYAHSSLSSFPSHLFSSKGNGFFTVSVGAHDERLIPDIVKYFKTWLAPATSAYNQEMKSKFLQTARQNEQQKQTEIAKAQAELRIKQSLQSLF